MEAIDRGELRGVENAAAEAAKVIESTQRKQRILRWVLSTIEAGGEEGVPHRDLSRKISGRDRKRSANSWPLGTRCSAQSWSTGRFDGIENSAIS
jgi:hypothetical protein